MEFYYSVEENVGIIISLLKAHGVKKVVASPGATNVCLVESMCYDGSFEMYSAVDERSAAYMACGMAAESGEPVVLTCTGATASRNYIPGMTEAFYRNLPVIAITAALHEGRLGQNFPQMIDRRSPLNDIVGKSVLLPMVQGEEDAWANNLKVNQALLAAKKGQPVHINWTTGCSTDYSRKELTPQRVIRRFTEKDGMPEISEEKVAIFVGAHLPMNEQLTTAIDRFCEKYNGVVLCDQTSNYRGKYRVLGNLVANQELSKSPLAAIPLMIYLGDVSGAYMTLNPKKVWRVHPDGEPRDYFKVVENIFEMDEVSFFEQYTKGLIINPKTSHFQEWKESYQRILEKVPELPFSNLWAAKQSADKLPKDSVLHLGILNSLRSWNFFETPDSVCCYSNTGGFGIDGNISSMVGASLVHPEKLYFAWVGDLSFFYDMNAIGNRHVGKNIRIMLINNGRGTEFRNYNHNGAIFGAEETDRFVAAAGHFGKQSPELVKQYAGNLGFEYMSASTKEEFLAVADRFFTAEMTEQPMLLEVFTDSQEESDALKIMNTLEASMAGTAKSAVKKLLGEQGIQTIKKVLGY